MDATEVSHGIGLMHSGWQSQLTDWAPTLLAASALAAAVFLPRGGCEVLRWTGIAILAPAAVLMFVPFVSLPRHGGTPRGRPYYDTTRIADKGAYALVRHPQYLGYMLLVIGFAMLSQHPVTALAAVLAIALFYAQLEREERALRERFAADWEDYAARVPRLNILAGIVRRLRRS